MIVIVRPTLWLTLCGNFQRWTAPGAGQADCPSNFTLLGIEHGKTGAQRYLVFTSARQHSPNWQAGRLGEPYSALLGGIYLYRVRGRSESKNRKTPRNLSQPADL